MFSLICVRINGLGKQSWGWWFQTSSCSLSRHCNVLILLHIRISHFSHYLTQTLAMNVKIVSMLSTYKAGETPINKIGNQSTGHKLQTYCTIKDYFGIENHILSMPVSKRRQFTKLKNSAHHLSIERGRYTWPADTPRHERYCSDCNDMTFGGKFHFMLNYPKYAW